MCLSFLIRCLKKYVNYFCYRLNGNQNVDDIRIEYEHLIPRPAQRQEEPDVLVHSMAQPNERNDRSTLPAGNGIDQKG